MGSKVSLLLTLRITVWPFDVSMIVAPSAGALATLAAPAMPGRFSTMTDWFQRSPSFSAIERARMSVMLPAENGTTRRTKRSG